MRFFGKLLKILHQTMYSVNWYVNITILAVSQYFRKCSDFNICRKTETKNCNTLIEDKGKILLILSEVNNNFNVYNYTSTTILQSQYIAICGFIFLITWQICFLKMETINCYAIKKWVNDKIKFLVKILNCFRLWKSELSKNRYLVFENLAFKLILSRKRHMWGIN